MSDRERMSAQAELTVNSSVDVLRSWAKAIGNSNLAADIEIGADEIERLQQRVAELEKWEERANRICNLVLRLNEREGLSPSALSGLQRMASAAIGGTQPAEPPSDDIASHPGFAALADAVIAEMRWTCVHGNVYARWIATAACGCDRPRQNRAERGREP